MAPYSRREMTPERWANVATPEWWSKWVKQSNTPGPMMFQMIRRAILIWREPGRLQAQGRASLAVPLLLRRSPSKKRDVPGLKRKHQCGQKKVKFLPLRWQRGCWQGCPENSHCFWLVHCTLSPVMWGRRPSRRKEPEDSHCCRFLCTVLSITSSLLPTISIIMAKATMKLGICT